jgi:hypothetical protein
MAAWLLARLLVRSAVVLDVLLLAAAVSLAWSLAASTLPNRGLTYGRPSPANHAEASSSSADPA